MRHQRYRYEDLRRDRKLVGSQERLVGPEINIMMFDYDLSFAGLRGVVHNLSIGPSDDLSFICYDRSDGRGLESRQFGEAGDGASDRDRQPNRREDRDSEAQSNVR